MAGQYLTLGEVRNAAIYRADLEGITDRHPTLVLNVEANLSYRALRVKLANNDVQMVLTPTAITALPSTEAFPGCGYAELDWPTAAVSVHGIDAKIGGEWDRLTEGTFSQRQPRGIGVSYGECYWPQWCVRSLPTTAAAVVTAGKIMLTPVPAPGSFYTLWFLTEWVDITLDTDLFPGQESWLQWVIWDLACKALIRDIGPQTSAQLQHCMTERDRCWADIRTNTTRLKQTEPIEMQSRYGRSSSRARMIP